MTEPVELRRMGVSELAYAVSVHPGAGDWCTLVVPDGALPEAVAEDLAEQLRIFTETPVHLVVATDDAVAILRTFGKTAPGVLIVKEVEPLSDDTLRHLDFARTRLMRDDAVVLVLHLATLRNLLRAAPNLASFVEGFVVMLDPDAEVLSSDEQASRLAALRAWAGLTDADVVALASEGKLPPDPEYAEWLVLLGQGGLIGRA